MKILLSNKQWKEIGKKAGWLKISLHYDDNEDENIVKTPDTQLENKVEPTVPTNPTNPKDDVFTPSDAASEIIEHFKPSGVILDPCKGEGAFSNLIPGSDWCEIKDNKDFMKYNRKVDWIIGNPPYSTFQEFLRHAIEIEAENILFLIPVNKIVNSSQVEKLIYQYGGIKEIYKMGSGRRLGFPLGFPVAAVHFQRGYKGPITVTYSPAYEKTLK